MMRRLGSILVAAALLVSIAGSAFAATVPQAVYTAAGEARFASEIQQSLATQGVKDVEVTHWAAGAISVLLDAGLLAPDAQGNLAPDSAMSFNSGVAVFAKVLGIASKTDSPEVAAQKAVEAGLIASKDGTLSRMDVAVMLFQALGLQEKQGVVADTLGFADAADIPQQYWGIVSALKDAGIFRGFPDGTFQAAGVLTAAQVATLVDRILGTFAN